MDSDNKDTKKVNEAEIDDKYITIKKLGEDPLYVSYLVKEKNSQKKYIAFISYFTSDELPENIQFPQQLQNIKFYLN